MEPIEDLRQNILICVSHPAHAPILIAQGSRLIRAFKEAEGLVVHIRREPYDGHEWADFAARQLFMSRCRHHELEFLEVEQGDDSVAEVLHRLTLERKATQILLGQAPAVGISALFSDSLTNQLLKLHPPAGLHIIDVSSCVEVTEDFFSGVDLSLVKEVNQWKLSRESAKEGQPGVKGTFFQSTYSDFENGFFVHNLGGYPEVLEIENGISPVPPKELS